MALLQQAPRLTAADAAGIARELYGLEAHASPLPSERDQNFLLEAEGGRSRFVLKIANATEDRAMLEAQNAAMAHLAQHTTLCQKVIPTSTGEEIAVLPDGRHFLRMVTWLQGVTLASVRRHSTGLLEDLGRRIGEVDRALATFDHPAIHRDFYWDFANGLAIVHDRLAFVQDGDLRALVERTAKRIELHDQPLFARLRRAAVHNDPNDHNVLVGGGDDVFTRNQRVTGLIDLGDMVHSFEISDLAIAIAYGVLDKPDPTAAAAAIVRGYHAVNSLTGSEIAVLFGLVCLRLCVSVVVAADQQRQRPGDQYLAVSQAPIRRTLPRLAAIPPRVAEATFRHACGWPPTNVVSGLSRTDGGFAPVLGKPIASEQLLVLDLSVGSPLVSGDLRENEEPALTPRIDAAMKRAGASVGVGRYGEARLLYASPLFDAEAEDDRQERRTVHLGLDLFVPAGTPVHAPLDGVVHAFADNAEPLDYGPVIILKHVRGWEGQEGQEETFYTMYGHLSRESLEGLSVGRAVARGERFATIGTADVNGGWTPHLHLQLILDPAGLDCDFPGVCRASEREIWMAFSPDPSVIAGVPASLFPLPEPDKAATLAARQRRIGRNLSIAYRDPVKAVRGWKQYLYDDTGRQYIDAYNNVPHVGHAHPRVVQAAADQMRVLNTNTRYLHDGLARYAERLSATLPDPLRVCYFVNSGSEANELALRLARAHTRQRDLIVLDAAYHGNTTTLVAISPYKFNGPGGEGAPPWVHTVAIPDVYRGPYKDPARAGAQYAELVRAAIDALQARGVGLAAYIAESAPSVGGQIILPPGYLDAVYGAVRAAGGVCIADEVQTAFGRLGTHFYAFEAQRVVPDLVVLGKPIGNGYPIGAVITTPAIAASFDNGMEFFSTFGGSIVSCAVGLAVLDVVEEERLQAHADRVGGRLLARLRELANRHALIGDVRGSGLFIGVELVRSRETLEPAAAEAAFVVNRMREEGILLGTDGPFANVLKIRPPMPFAEADGDALAQALDRILEELS